MSGSSSNSFGGGFESGDVDCDNLVLNTQIASPQPAVISKLQVNDILQVELDTVGATTAIVLRHQTVVAGAIASPDMQRLRQCLEGGTHYQAEVTAISGAQVSIRISAA
jgi:hypothetical protein